MDPHHDENNNASPPPSPLKNSEAECSHHKEDYSEKDHYHQSFKAQHYTTNNNTIDDDHHHHSDFPKNLLPKYLLADFSHHHHHHEQDNTTTDATSDITGHNEEGGEYHDESAKEVAIHKIEEVAERFANATKSKSKKALKLITVSPFNIFKEIMDEEEDQSSGEDDLENNQPTVSHSRTASIESLPKEDIIEESRKDEAIPSRLTDSQAEEAHRVLDESTHLVENPEFTPMNRFNQEDSGKPIKFHTHFCLCSFDETPDFLRNNPYIRNHYRKYFSFKLSLQSIFKMHNETINIWTHMLPIFGCIGLIFYTIYFMVAVHNTGANAQNILDMFIVIIYLGMAINCFFCSSMYHTLNCHSKKIWSISYRCDVSAISGLIGSSIIPALYFNLYCYVGWQIVYISSIGLFAVVGMIFPCLPFKSPRALKIFGIVRTVLFISMVLSAIIPIAHFLLFILPLKQEYTGSFYSDYNQDFMIGIIITVSLYGVGLLFWLTKFPERLFPGKFDLFLSSHNIWHAFIVAASTLWYYYCLSLYKVKVEKIRAGLACPSDAF